MAQQVVTGFPVVLNSADTVSEAELGYVDGALPGQIVASKAAVYNSSGQLAVKRKVSLASVAGATLALSSDDSGALVLFDRAAGCVVTLPAAAAGLWFDFLVSVSVTSNANKIITNTIASEFIFGQLLSIDTDSSNVLAWTHVANGTTIAAINMAAASTNATGGLLYTKMRLLCVSATLWTVEGINMGAGSVSTPFATS